MKVLLINGSPRVNGNTSISLNEMVKVFNEEGIETEVIDIGNRDIHGCIACNYCKTNKKGCVFNDLVNEVSNRFETSDGLVIASPVYYGSANGSLISFLDRLFYSSTFDKTMKVGASVAVGRRGGLSATYDELNKYFAITGMPIASGQYWNGVHGRDVGEVVEDYEGLQQMRVLARNMVFLLKAIKDAKEKYGLPAKETPIRTNFIRKLED